LEPPRRSRLDEAIRARDFHAAETLLLEETKLNPKSFQLLSLLGGIFFQDGQYLNAAIAIKKAEAINPLDDSSRFTLAMTYIILNHRDWARPELEKLAQNNPSNALYPYWLSRLNYDAHQYQAAIAKLETVLKLDSNFMRAHDNLGLCYETLGKQDEAIHSYLEAVRLNRLKNLKSPWPSLNLGALMLKQGKLDEAAHYFGVESRRVPVGADWRAEPGAMAGAVDDDTVLVVASAPQYPQGVVD
jgi:tetratricopeptide (TPR) repeat protein